MILKLNLRVKDIMDKFYIIFRFFLTYNRLKKYNFLILYCIINSEFKSIFISMKITFYV